MIKSGDTQRMGNKKFGKILVIDDDEEAGEGAENVEGHNLWWGGTAAPAALRRGGANRPNPAPTANLERALEPLLPEPPFAPPPAPALALARPRLPDRFRS